jgi:hypothetical protein
MKTPLNELRRASLPGAIIRTRRALTVAWRRSREPAVRGAARTPDRTAWAFVAWIAIVGVGYALIRLMP